MTEDEFEAQFEPLSFTDEMGQEAPEGVQWVEFEVAKRYPPERVWSVVDGDDGEYYLPGFHVVNKFAYIITKKPWTDETLEVRVDSMEDEDEPDGAPCCQDPECGGNPCTFPGYADNH